MKQAIGHQRSSLSKNTTRGWGQIIAIKETPPQKKPRVYKCYSEWLDSPRIIQSKKQKQRIVNRCIHKKKYMKRQKTVILTLPEPLGEIAITQRQAQVIYLTLRGHRISSIASITQTHRKSIEYTLARCRKKFNVSNHLDFLDFIYSPTFRTQFKFQLAGANHPLAKPLILH